MGPRAAQLEQTSPVRMTNEFVGARDDCVWRVSTRRWMRWPWQLQSPPRGLDKYRTNGGPTRYAPRGHRRAHGRRTPDVYSRRAPEHPARPGSPRCGRRALSRRLTSAVVLLAADPPPRAGDRAWQASSRRGARAARIPPALVPPQYPSAAQATLLLREGVREPLVRTLTTIAIIEGFGAMIRDQRVPD